MPSRGRLAGGTIMKARSWSVRLGRAVFGARALLWMAGLAVAFGTLAVAGLASAAVYVDAGTTDLKPEDKVVVAHPQPVQLLFEFQTKGAPNARATKFLKSHVVDTVKASGLFSDVSDAATANGAIVSVVINNVINPEELRAAEGKGFVTGATFFVAGSNVRDSYICTIDYVAGPHSAKITRTAHHAVITQMGLINSPPVGAVKIGSMNDAVFTMARQIVANPLNAIAGDPGFQPAPTAPMPAPQAQPAPTVDPVQPATPASPAPVPASLPAQVAPAHP